MKNLLIRIATSLLVAGVLMGTAYGDAKSSNTGFIVRAVAVCPDLAQ